MVAGTFDNFHVGHQFLLWSAYELADEIFIVVARDETVKKIKLKKACHDENSRKNRIKNEFLSKKNVHILLGRKDMKFMQMIRDIDPSIIYFGYDQRVDKAKISREFPQIKLIRAKAYNPEIFKSSFFEKK